MFYKTKRRKNFSEFRSGLEVDNADHLRKHGINYAYEEVRIPFTQPEKPRHYTPDFVLDNGLIIETKGEFTSADRVKHLLIKEQYPELDIRFVFSNARQVLYNGSTTTYAQWCEKHGFIWAHRMIPICWAQVPKDEVAFQTILRLRKSKCSGKS